MWKQGLSQIAANFDHFLTILLGRGPPTALVPAALSPCPALQLPASFHQPQALDKGLLWAVPKSRRTREKRASRRFGFKEYVWKMLEPKTNLLVCRECGHYHPADCICGFCYEKVRKETEEIQKAMLDGQELKPVEKDVIILYEGEALSSVDEFHKGKRIVEMKKKRPSWFCNNLLQKSTDRPENEQIKDVKPTELA